MNVIVTTTINSPTQSTIEFAKQNLPFIIVGDTKTPHEEYRKLQKQYENIVYLEPSEQEQLYPALSKILGWKTIQRRNIGFLYAFHLGANICISVDDDNQICSENWGKNLLLLKEIDCLTVECNYESFDPLTFIGGDYQPFWSRGYPIELVRHKSTQVKNIARKTHTFDLQADLWYNSIDCDAICRILYGDKAYSCNENLFPFTSDKLQPINSQNTFITRKALPYYFMFPFVGRMDDLYGAYYCQAYGFKGVYNKPTVNQYRNEHNTVKDMEKELHGYQNLYQIIINLYKDPESIWQFVPENTKEAYFTYKNYFH